MSLDNSIPRSVISDIAAEGQPKRIRVLMAGELAKEYRLPITLPSHLYETVALKTAKEIRDVLGREEFDLILINSALPDLDSISAIQYLASIENPPYIIIRSETDDELDRVLALELGADDCVASSCGQREVKSRIRSLFRRREIERSRNKQTDSSGSTLTAPQLSYAGWILHKNKRHLFSPSGASIPLTNAEYSILQGLFEEPGVIKDRTSLRRAGIGEAQQYNDRTINAFVSRLRKKLQAHGGMDLIESVRGQGYRLNAL